MGAESVSSRPVVSAFWHAFSFSDAEGRKSIRLGLPAPVVRRVIDRLRVEVPGREAPASGPAAQGNSTSPADDGRCAQAPSPCPPTSPPNGGCRDEERDGPPGTRTGIGLDDVRENCLAASPCLPVKLVTMELSRARAGLGLSDFWGRLIQERCGDRQKQVLVVHHRMAGTPAFSVLEIGDIVLAVEEGAVVTRIAQIEAAVEGANGAPVRLTILRQLEELVVTVRLRERCRGSWFGSQDCTDLFAECPK